MAPLTLVSGALHIPNLLHVDEAFSEAERLGFLDLPEYAEWRKKTMISRATVASWYRKWCVKVGRPCLIIHHNYHSTIEIGLWLYGPNVGLMRTQFIEPWVSPSPITTDYQGFFINQKRTIIRSRYQTTAKLRVALLKSCRQKHNRHLFTTGRQ